MSVIDQLISVEAGQIGYQSGADPSPGSKYGRWIAAQLNQSWLAGPSASIAWCAIFQSWALAQVGVSVPGMPGYNCDTILNACHARGLTVAVSAARRGDLVIYDWDHNGSGDHIGLVEQRQSTTVIQTLEGNTSSGVAGSQSNGGGVWRRTRNLNYVKAVIRPNYAITSTANVATTLQPTEFLESVITNMKATHIIFQYNNGLCIANILAGTYSLQTTPKNFTEHVMVLKRAGAKIAEWKTMAASKSNIVANPAAFGVRVN
jgi:hypothetical protein